MIAILAHEHSITLPNRSISTSPAECPRTRFFAYARYCDAASNRGVGDIRDLRERVLLRPTVGQFKVYIIDEVHMLTTEAFNALLKTLEEPPPQVVMILATTDIHRVPATIISRCQRFDFRRLTPDDVIGRLGAK